MNRFVNTTLLLLSLIGWILWQQVSIFSLLSPVPAQACTWVVTSCGAGCADNKDLYNCSQAVQVQAVVSSETNVDSNAKAQYVAPPTVAQYVPPPVENTQSGSYDPTKIVSVAAIETIKSTPGYATSETVTTVDATGRGGNVEEARGQTATKVKEPPPPVVKADTSLSISAVNPQGKGEGKSCKSGNECMSGSCEKKLAVSDVDPFTGERIKIFKSYCTAPSMTRTCWYRMQISDEWTCQSTTRENLASCSDIGMLSTNVGCKAVNNVLFGETSCWQIINNSCKKTTLNGTCYSNNAFTTEGVCDANLQEIKQNNQKIVQRQEQIENQRAEEERRMAESISQNAAQAQKDAEQTASDAKRMRYIFDLQARTKICYNPDYDCEPFTRVFDLPSNTCESAGYYTLKQHCENLGISISGPEEQEIYSKECFNPGNGCQRETRIFNSPKSNCESIGLITFSSQCMNPVSTVNNDNACSGEKDDSKYNINFTTGLSPVLCTDPDGCTCPTSLDISCGETCPGASEGGANFGDVGAAVTEALCAGSSFGKCKEGKTCLGTHTPEGDITYSCQSITTAGSGDQKTDDKPTEAQVGQPQCFGTTDGACPAGQRCQQTDGTNPKILYYCVLTDEQLILSGRPTCPEGYYSATSVDHSKLCKIESDGGLLTKGYYCPGSSYIYPTENGGKSCRPEDSVIKIQPKQGDTTQASADNANTRNTLTTIINSITGGLGKLLGRIQTNQPASEDLGVILEATYEQLPGCPENYELFDKIEDGIACKELQTDKLSIKLYCHSNQIVKGEPQRCSLNMDGVRVDQPPADQFGGVAEEATATNESTECTATTYGSCDEGQSCVATDGSDPNTLFTCLTISNNFLNALDKCPENHSSSVVQNGRICRLDEPGQNSTLGYYCPAEKPIRKTIKGVEKCVAEACSTENPTGSCPENQVCKGQYFSGVGTVFSCEAIPPSPATQAVKCAGSSFGKCEEGYQCRGVHTPEGDITYSCQSMAIKLEPKEQVTNEAQVDPTECFGPTSGACPVGQICKYTSSFNIGHFCALTDETAEIEDCIINKYEYFETPGVDGAVACKFEGFDQEIIRYYCPENSSRRTVTSDKCETDEEYMESTGFQVSHSDGTNVFDTATGAVVSIVKGVWNAPLMPGAFIEAGQVGIKGGGVVTALGTYFTGTQQNFEIRKRALQLAFSGELSTEERAGAATIVFMPSIGEAAIECTDGVSWKCVGAYTNTVLETTDVVIAGSGALRHLSRSNIITVDTAPVLTNNVSSYDAVAYISDDLGELLTDEAHSFLNQTSFSPYTTSNLSEAVNQAQLSGVNDVYIFGHGGTVFRMNGVRLTPDELADQLIQGGVWSGCNLHLMSCSTGLSIDGATSYIDQVAQSLSERNLSGVSLRGPTGVLKLNDGYPAVLTEKRELFSAFGVDSEIIVGGSQIPSTEAWHSVFSE